MIDIKIILFDVDGTLVDSKKVIIDAANHTLLNLGFKQKKEEEIINHLGFEISYIISKLTGSYDPALLIRGVKLFNGYWREHITADSMLFKGVIKTLDYLKSKEMIITSNGIREVIEKMLNNFKIRKFFKEIISGDKPDCIKPTACPINMVFDSFKLGNRTVDKDRIMIVGDMDIDIKAGKNAGIKTCAVTYGIGKKKDIIKAKPDFLIDDISELKNIIKIQ
jgi:phosphoglycolate phosphatase-like HAD superfamily hydrolase